MKTLRLLIFCCCLFLGALTARSAHADAPAFASTSMTVNKTTTYLLDTVLYTVKLDNTAGTADALDVVFTDHLPAGMEVQLFSLDGLPQVVTLLTDGLYVGTIPAGTSRTITILGVVSGIPVRPAVASYVNQASWTYRYRPTPGAPKVNASFTTNAVTTNMVRLETTMAIANVALAPILNLGTEMTFTIKVTNTGTLNSAGTTLTNLIPVGALYVAGSTKMNGVTLPDIGVAGPFVLGNSINSPNRPAGQINIGETATISFKATALVLPAVNVAVVDPDGLLNPIPPLNLRGYIEGATTDLSITKTDGVTTVSPGSNVTYTIAVKNTGATTVDSVTVVDNLPLTLQNPTWTASTGTYNPSSGEWTGLSLANGQTITLTLKTKVSPLALTNVVNTVTVYPPSGVTDSNAANDSATDTDTLSILADLGVTQTNSVSSISAGAPVTYTITVSNSGPSAVTGLTLTDTLPSALQSPVFTPDEGTYNSTTKAWTGLNLQPGNSVQMTLTGTVSAAATGTLVNTVVVSPTTGTTDLVSTNNTAVDTDTIIPAASLGGFVYLDDNHSGTKDGAEVGTGMAGLFVKLVPAAGTSATSAVAVNATTGVYLFPSVLPDTYNLILDDNNSLTDITPALPNGYIGVEASAQRRDNTAVGTANLTDQNFGLWHGAKVSGEVWNDNGTGGGTPNDILRSGGEGGMAGVVVKATVGATTLDTAVTDGSGSYTLWIPFGATNPVQITPVTSSGYFAMGGRAGTTGGTYTRAGNAVSFTFASGTSYSGTGFAVVPVNTLSGSTAQSVTPGSALFFAHTFTAGSAGTVTFSESQTNTPALAGWSATVYQDTNANGMLDVGEPPVTTPLHLGSGVSMAVVVRVGVPLDALPGAQSQSLLSASYLYDTVAPALTSTLTSTDSATVGTVAGLQLVQTVDKAQAKTGQIITYTITYRNNSVVALNGVGIRNSTPAFTSFVAASYGTLPAGVTACTMTKPAAGATGSIAWDFTGSLPPSGSGSVSFQVQVQ